MHAKTPVALTLGVLAAANLLSHRIVPRASGVVAVAEVGALAVIARSAGLTAGDLGLGRSAVRPGVRWGAGSALVVATGYGMALAGPATRAAIPGSGNSMARAAVRAGLVIPLTTVLPEEFAFRGVLAGLLTRRLGARRSLLLSSALFGMWHVLPGLAGDGAANESVDRIIGNGARGRATRVAGTVAVTTVGGLAMGELRRRSGSLLAPVLLHWAVNGLGELITAGVGRVGSVGHRHHQNDHQRDQDEKAADPQWQQERGDETGGDD